MRKGLGLSLAPCKLCLLVHADNPRIWGMQEVGPGCSSYMAIWRQQGIVRPWRSVSGWTGYKCQHSLRNRMWLGPLSSLGDPVFPGSHHKYNLSGLGSFLLTLLPFVVTRFFLSLYNKLTHRFTDNESTSIVSYMQFCRGRN